MHSGRSEYTSDDDSEEYNKTLESDSFQSRDHMNILHLMSLMRSDINPSGMCHGFALTALHYYNKGKINEYDELIAELLEIYHQSFSDGVDGIDERMKKKLQDLNELQKENGKITVDKLFKHVVEYQNNQDVAEDSDKMQFTPAVDGIYDDGDIINYLQSLYDIHADESSKSAEPFPLSLILSSSQHTLLLAFQDGQILIRDINYPHKHYFEGTEQIFALALNQTDASSLLVSTSFFIPQNSNAQHTLTCLQRWQETPEYQTIHEISEDRVSRVGKDGNSLLSNAILKKQSQLVKTIIESLPEDVDQTIFSRALFIAILEKEHEVIETLLENPNFDINIPAESLAHGYSLSPLCSSILYADDLLSEKMISHHADLDSRNSIRLSLLENHDAFDTKKDRLAAIFNESTGFHKNKIIRELTPLHLAALIGNRNAVQRLLRHDAKIMMCEGNLCADDLAKGMGDDAMAADILNKCKQDVRIELESLAANSGFDTTEFDLIQKSLDSQQSAKDCLNIMSCLKNIAHLSSLMTDDPIIAELFSDHLASTKAQLFQQLSQSDNASNSITPINNSVVNLIDDVDIIQSIGYSQAQPDANNQFYEQRKNATVRAKKYVAANGADNVTLINQALSMLDKFTKVIQTTESSRFMPQVVHQDWKNLVRECYDQIGSDASQDYVLIINKMKIVTEHPSRPMGQGFQKPIDQLRDPHIINTLTQPFEAAMQNKPQGK